MTEQDIINKNIGRVNLRLQPLRSGITDQLKKDFKKHKIMCDGKEVSLLDIDFNKSMIFVGKEDFSPYIAYYGMSKVNNVLYPDKTLSGVNSMITKTYMIVDSRDIRFSKIPLDSFYAEDRDGDLPESWNCLNYKKKDIIVWRLVSDVGIGDNNKMYDGCCSWIGERYRDGTLDWAFYIGALEAFKNEYSELVHLGLPIYNIIPKRKSAIEDSRVTDLRGVTKTNSKGEVF